MCRLYVYVYVCVYVSQISLISLNFPGDRSCSTLQAGCKQLAKQRDSFLGTEAEVFQDSGPRIEFEGAEDDVSPESSGST